MHENYRGHFLPLPFFLSGKVGPPPLGPAPSCPGGCPGAGTRATAYREGGQFASCPVGVACCLMNATLCNRGGWSFNNLPIAVYSVFPGGER